MPRIVPWEEDARCGGQDPELFFDGHPLSQRRARQLCARCPVRVECLAAAMAGGVEFGIWGGLDERERRRLRRMFPRTRDWRGLLRERGVPERV